jgi:hypothetical protein
MHYRFLLIKKCTRPNFDKFCVKESKIESPKNCETKFRVLYLNDEIINLPPKQEMALKRNSTLKNEDFAFFRRETELVLSDDAVWVKNHGLLELATIEQCNDRIEDCAKIYNRNWWEENNEIFEVTLPNIPKHILDIDWPQLKEVTE